MTDDRISALEAALRKLEIEVAILKQMDKRLTSIENNTQWLVRLVIGALVLALIGFAMNGGFVLEG